jgi:hypothetical protein
MASGDIPKGSFPESLDLSELTKLITVATAFAYAIGVVAVNTYLHDLGIVDFSFAKPKLLLTGVLVLFTLLLLASPAFFLAWHLGNHAGKKERVKRPRGILVSLASVIVVLLVASACLCFRQGGPGLGQITVWRLWEIMKPKSDGKRALTALLLASVVYLPIVVGSISVYYATLFFKRTGQEKCVHNCASRLYLLVATSFVVISIIGYIYIFAATFYPAIPQEFGGGQPYYESFSIAESDRCLLQQLGIPFNAHTPNITELLPVVHETDTQVAVWLKEKEAGEWQFAVGELDKRLIGSMMAHQAAGKPVAVLTSLPCTP